MKKVSLEKKFMAKKISKKKTTKKKVGRPTKVKAVSAKKETFEQFQKNATRIEPVIEKIRQLPGAKFKTEARERKVFLVPLSKEGIKESENIAKQKNNIHRDKYREAMTNCEQCRNSFDYNKAYPSGKVDNNSKVLCPKCQNNRGGR